MIERIKNLFGVVMILAFALDISAAQEVPAPQNVYAREALSLNGEWHYFMDVQEMGYYDYFMNKVPWGYFNNAKPQNPWDMVEYDFDASPTMQIPTDWNTADPQLMFYEGTVWFRKTFNYNPVDNRRALLYFGAVNYEAIVFVNGAEVGRRIGGFTPFCYDVTETPHGAARDSFLSRLATSARMQDSTRLISMAMEVLSASNYVNRLQDNMHEYVDVVSFNQYVGWYRDVNDAQRMTWEVPYDKPVIVSEFGGGALAGNHGAENQRWTEEFQERLYRENLAMLDRIEGLAGTSPWCLKDFRSPRRPLPNVQDYFNRKGLYSDQGKRKRAFFVLRDWYREKAERYQVK